MAVFVMGLQAALGAIPEPWKQGDIGSVGVAGSGSENAGTWTVAGSGADIWSTADAFHYVYQRLNGNMQVVVKVTTVQNQNAWSKAGIMFRDDLTAGARHVSLFVTPGNGIALQSRATAGQTCTNTAVAGFAAPYWIKLARSGNQFTAWRSPDNITWTQVGTRTIDMDPVLFVGLAVTSHNNPVLCTATFTNLSLNKPPVLFVTASSTLNAGDAAAKKRLEILGYAVTVKTAAASVSADANGKDLVVISSSITSADVNTKFRNATVPVLLWESALLDDMGMTGTVAGTDYGTAATQSQVAIAASACNRATMYTAATGWGDGCQDLAAGLTGNVDVTRNAQILSWGVPNANAIKIAALAANPNRFAEFAYEKGAAMPGLAAPARRVFLFLEDNTASAWSPRGQALFDNAVYWATSTKYSVTRKVLVLNFDPILATKGNIRLHQYTQTSPRWAWNDPIPLIRDYLADLTEASGGYVRWKWAYYPGIPNYLDQWAPITGTQQFRSATYSEQDYLNAYNIYLSTGDGGAAASAMPNGGNYQADYNAIFTQFGLDAKIQAGEVDEVLTYSYPYSGIQPAGMAGAQPYELYAPIIGRRPGLKNTVVMGFTYDKGLPEALELFGHRAEAFLDHHAFFQAADTVFTVPYFPCIWPDFPAGEYCGATRQTTPQRSLYDRFSAVEGILAGNAGVGANRFAPNAATRGNDENALGNLSTAYSMADDWQFNYPALAGAATKRLVNANEWIPYAQNGDAWRGFRKWWLLHMPRVPGAYPNDGNVRNKFRLNNWWEYLVDFNKQPETQR